MSRIVYYECDGCRQRASYDESHNFRIIQILPSERSDEFWVLSLCVTCWRKSVETLLKGLKAKTKVGDVEVPAAVKYRGLFARWTLEYGKNFSDR